MVSIQMWFITIMLAIFLSAFSHLFIYFMICLFKCYTKILSIYLFERQKDVWRRKAPVHWFSPQVFAMASTGSRVESGDSKIPMLLELPLLLGLHWQEAGVRSGRWNWIQVFQNGTWASSPARVTASFLARLCMGHHQVSISRSWFDKVSDFLNFLILKSVIYYL